MEFECGVRYERHDETENLGGELPPRLSRWIRPRSYQQPRKGQDEKRLQHDLGGVHARASSRTVMQQGVAHGANEDQDHVSLQEKELRPIVVVCEEVHIFELKNSDSFY